MVGLLTNGAIATATTRQSAGQRNTGLFAPDKLRHVSLPGVCLPFSRNEGHYQRILAILARLVPYEYCPIAEVIGKEAPMFSPGTTSRPDPALHQSPLHREERYYSAGRKRYCIPA